MVIFHSYVNVYHRVIGATPILVGISVSFMVNKRSDPPHRFPPRLPRQPGRRFRGLCFTGVLEGRAEEKGKLWENMGNTHLLWEHLYKWGTSSCYVWLLEGTQKIRGRSSFFQIKFGSLWSIFAIILGENTHFVDPWSEASGFASFQHRFHDLNQLSVVSNSENLRICVFFTLINPIYVSASLSKSPFLHIFDGLKLKVSTIFGG